MVKQTFAYSANSNARRGTKQQEPENLTNQDLRADLDSNKLSSLALCDYNHILGRGFTPEQIAKMEELNLLKSVYRRDAEELGVYNLLQELNDKAGYAQDHVGLLFDFGKGFYQIRPDYPKVGTNGRVIKYQSPYRVPSQVWMPENAQGVTEGMFDALVLNFHYGYACGAMAGVSHYKLLPQNSKLTIFFDNDAWHNPQVVHNLVNAAEWTGGKIVIIPECNNDKKSGAEEYFKAGHTKENFEELVNKAHTPKDFIKEALRRVNSISDQALLIRKLLWLASSRIPREAYIAEVDDLKKRLKFGADTRKIYIELGQKALDFKKKYLALQKKKSNDKPSKRKPDPHLRLKAEKLLSSGKFFELVGEIVRKAGIVGIEDHVNFGLQSTLGTLSGRVERAQQNIWNGSTSAGKSVVMNAIESLTPPESRERLSAVTYGWLKRSGSVLDRKVIFVDEMSTLFSDPLVVTLFKELITRGQCNLRLLEKEDDTFVPTEFLVTATISLQMGATDATLTSIFGEAEDEIRSRFNEPPMPEDQEYMRGAAWNSLIALEPKRLEDIDPESVEIVREAIRIAAESPLPTFSEEFAKLLFDHIEVKQTTMSRMLKRLNITLTNTALLLGKKEVDFEVYDFVYPMVSKIFRRKLTTSNDLNLNNIVTLYEWLDSNANGDLYKSFKVTHIMEAFKCGKTKAYKLCDTLEGANWIEESGYGKYNLTSLACSTVKDIREERLQLPDILPRPSVIRAKATFRNFPHFSAKIPHTENAQNPYSLNNKEEYIEELSALSAQKEHIEKNCSSSENNNRSLVSPNETHKGGKNIFSNSPKSVRKSGKSDGKNAWNADVERNTDDGRRAESARKVAESSETSVESARKVSEVSEYEYEGKTYKAGDEVIISYPGFPSKKETGIIECFTVGSTGAMARVHIIKDGVSTEGIYCFALHLLTHVTPQD
ncbi:MAG: hypothetical protein NHB32_14050 [Fischerella sp. CENA71]|nr:hypothetical protein [Fischerella sp. CENA71]